MGSGVAAEVLCGSTKVGLTALTQEVHSMFGGVDALHTVGTEEAGSCKQFGPESHVAMMDLMVPKIGAMVWPETAGYRRNQVRAATPAGASRNHYVGLLKIGRSSRSPVEGGRLAWIW